jgi:hypothetical protein
VRLAVLALAALALTGCETTAENSAKLERAAKHVSLTQQKGLSIERASTAVKVVATTVVRGSEGAAAVVTLRNGSARALSNLPIAIDVKDARGASVYANNVPGLSRTLVSVGSIPAGATLTWVDDQIQPTGVPASVSAEVGEGTRVSGAPPRLDIEEAGLHDDPTSGLGAEGTVVNHSRVTQQELVVYAVARRSGKIVAAGRAVLASLPAGASTPFQIFFVGDARGAQLQVSAPPTTPG